MSLWLAPVTIAARALQPDHKQDYGVIPNFWHTSEYYEPYVCPSEKHYAAAIQLYTKAIGFNPNNAIYWSNRAAAHIKLENYGAAVTDAEKATELDPKYIKVGYDTVRSRLATGPSITHSLCARVHGAVLRGHLRTGGPAFRGRASGWGLGPSGMRGMAGSGTHREPSGRKLPLGACHSCSAWVDM